MLRLIIFRTVLYCLHWQLHLLKKQLLKCKKKNSLGLNTFKLTKVNKKSERNFKKTRSSNKDFISIYQQPISDEHDERLLSFVEG